MLLALIWNSELILLALVKKNITGKNTDLLKKIQFFLMVQRHLLYSMFILQTQTPLGLIGENDRLSMTKKEGNNYFGFRD